MTAMTNSLNWQRTAAMLPTDPEPAEDLYSEVYPAPPKADRGHLIASMDLDDGAPDEIACESVCQIVRFLVVAVLAVAAAYGAALLMPLPH